MTNKANRPERPGKPVSQSQKFIDAAREHGCDESEAEFERKLQKIAQQKPKAKGSGGERGESS